MPELEGRDLVCMRGGRVLFEDLSFTLEPGAGLVLLGPNGSGKSSLLRLLAGFIQPHAGELLVDGTATRLDSSAYRSLLHFVGHANAIKSLLSVRENLAFMASVTGGDALVQARDRLGLDGLEDRLGRYLSAGQKRRLALARLVAARRPIWLLDEPGVGLDRASRERLEALIAEHRADGGICIVATHGDVALTDHLVLELGQ